jgi:hypothetical protein
MHSNSTGQSSEWASWYCPFCNAEHDDPVRTTVTTCSKGHVVYLGRVYQQHRPAFKTKAARTDWNRREKMDHDFVQDVLKAWGRTNPKMLLP